MIPQLTSYYTSTKSAQQGLGSRYRRKANLSGHMHAQDCTVSVHATLSPAPSRPPPARATRGRLLYTRTRFRIVMLYTACLLALRIQEVVAAVVAVAGGGGGGAVAVIVLTLTQRHNLTPYIRMVRRQDSNNNHGAKKKAT